MFFSDLQEVAFQAPGRGIRKMILSTNVAETSITIKDVVYVIDTGRLKVENFEPIQNYTRYLPILLCHYKQITYCTFLQ